MQALVFDGVRRIIDLDQEPFLEANEIGNVSAGRNLPVNLKFPRLRSRKARQTMASALTATLRCQRAKLIITRRGI
jgi:hypothetical protein